jgi:nitrite reductase/ring-hydroxylating ferredoxin subunit
MSNDQSKEGWQAVGDALSLIEGGEGQRFELQREGLEALAGFCVRFEGRPRAYLNRCAHVPVELDWQPGNFFDESGSYLICATHGAMYEADSGVCVAGPCRGKALRPLLVKEAAGMLWVKMDTSPPPETS